MLPQLQSRLLYAVHYSCFLPIVSMTSADDRVDDHLQVTPSAPSPSNHLLFVHSPHPSRHNHLSANKVFSRRGSTCSTQLLALNDSHSPGYCQAKYTQCTPYRCYHSNGPAPENERSGVPHKAGASTQSHIGCGHKV